MPAFTTRPEIRGTFGVVASTHWLASAVGMSILEKGGNAFDAAAAAGFTLQVVEPHLNGPLGRGADPGVERGQAALRDDLRPGRGARRRDDRPLSRARTRPDPRHRAARRDGAGRVRRAGCGCCATRARCRSPRFWRRRSAMPRTAIRWSSASARRSPSIAEMFRHGMAELGGGLSAERPAAGSRAGCSATRHWPRPTAGFWPRPRRRRRPRAARSSAPATPGIAALSPRRSTGSAAAKRCSTRRGGGMTAC